MVPDNETTTNSGGDFELLQISVVVPCLNEEDVIEDSYRRLREIVDGIDACRAELIFIDDGSMDSTWERLVGISEQDPRVRLVRFSRNFGHQMAITAGIQHASGNAIVIIDADLQDPPELIPEMIRAWREGNQVVFGKRTDREGESRFKVWTARAFYRLLQFLSDTDIPLDTGDFRLIDRKVADDLLAMPERDRFVRGMVAWVGYRQVAIPYQRKPRLAGSTKFPFARMVRFALDGIFSFSFRPLRLASLLGFSAAGIAVVVIVYALVARLVGTPVTGWTAIITSVLFLGGVQLICLGIIGEYIGRIYGEVKRRPLYLVDETRGFDRVGSIPDDHATTGRNTAA